MKAIKENENENGRNQKTKDRLWRYPYLLHATELIQRSKSQAGPKREKYPYK